MTEKKSVLNVTVAESVAGAVRREAAIRNVTISSVVEAALAEQLKWYQIRADGLAAVEEEYREAGHPTAEAEADAAAWVEEASRQLSDALADEQPRTADVVDGAA
ncbi:MAG TPA: hypothetical protein VGG35_12630 [Streptosporangiaceae bacterium]|jgi:hypothetical protein